MNDFKKFIKEDGYCKAILIAKIIKGMNDIAFQTNILTLNVAIEAARTRDSGMELAVAAEALSNRGCPKKYYILLIYFSDLRVKTHNCIKPIKGFQYKFVKILTRFNGFDRNHVGFVDWRSNHRQKIYFGDSPLFRFWLS